MDGAYHVFAKGGREDTGLDAIEWIKRGEAAGAGEIVVNSIDTDGVKEGFDIDSHKRLAKLFDELTDKGCYCMLTNHNTDLINELYGNKGYKIDVVSVKRMLNSDASNRVGEEVIICNY